MLNGPNRLKELEREREEKKRAFEKQRERVNKSVNDVGLRNINDAFASQNTFAEDAFKRSTVGLVSAEDFKRKRRELENDEKNRIKLAEKLKRKERKKREKKRKAQLKVLSFNNSDDDDNDDVNNNDNIIRINKKIKKDPTVNTIFLPDKEREEEEEKLREKLKKEWMEKQEAIKNEILELSYSYHDGCGHSHKIRITRGTSIGEFLDLCRKDLCKSFHELIKVASVNLLYVKEDTIIPQHYTFYELTTMNAQGRIRPLFDFATKIDKNEKIVYDQYDIERPGKVVTRIWYERNKNEFPASLWSEFKPKI